MRNELRFMALRAAREASVLIAAAYGTSGPAPTAQTGRHWSQPTGGEYALA